MTSLLDLPCAKTGASLPPWCAGAESGVFLQPVRGLAPRPLPAPVAANGGCPSEMPCAAGCSRARKG